MGRRSLIRRAAANRDRVEQRRRWAAAMSLRAFGALGILNHETELLAVGPDNDEAIGWLTAHTRRVFATELDTVEGAANPRRLVIQPMSAVELRYEDGSMDAVLCSNTLEHLAGPEEARRAALEIHRVLKPGGAAAVSTTFRAEGSPDGRPGLLLYDEPVLRATLLGDGLSWAIADPLEANAPDPQVVSRDGDLTWTSVHLLLVKPLYH